MGGFDHAISALVNVNYRYKIDDLSQPPSATNFQFEVVIQVNGMIS